MSSPPMVPNHCAPGRGAQLKTLGASESNLNNCDESSNLDYPRGDNILKELSKPTKTAISRRIGT